MIAAFTQPLIDITRRAARVDAPMSANPVVAGPGDPAAKLRSLTAELDALRREHAEVKQAVYEAAQIQRKLCAPHELTWREFEIAGEIFPVRHLCGDFFKVVELGDALGLAVGDIAGKGLTAGIWQAHLMGLLQRAAREHSTPGDAVAEVNHQLCQDDGAPPILALFYAHLGPKNNLLYCNAGLPAPLLLKASNSRLERLEEGGPMLGAVKDAFFPTGNVSFDPGDMLVAYSDGVTECRNSADQEFEMQRLMDATSNVSNATASKALFSLLGTVLDFAGSCPPGDDMTLLVARRHPVESSHQPSLAKGSSAPNRRRARPRSRRKSAGEGLSFS